MASRFAKIKGAKAYTDWEECIRALEARFGNHAFDDPLAELRNLKQIDSLQEYLNAFDELYPKAGITEEQSLSFFLSGLNDELQMPIRMFKPRTLAEAYSLARLQELTIAAIQQKPKSMARSTFSPATNTSYHKPLTITTSTGYPKPSLNTKIQQTCNPIPT